jgi:pimeloyl-ACP methyl ester carboxylesterase
MIDVRARFTAGGESTDTAAHARGDDDCPMTEGVTIASGAEMRTTGAGPDAVVCVNGGGRAEVEGTWSATVEWLVGRLSSRFPTIRFAEVRYRIKSWRRIDLCVEDGLAALESLAPRRALMLGFSMGGAVSVRLAVEPVVTAVLGLAPWLPERLDLAPLDGKRLAIIHGALDSPLPGIPGVTAKSSRHAFERARARGIDAAHVTVHGGLHGVAIRSPVGLVPLPRARTWLARVSEEIGRFEGEDP